MIPRDGRRARMLTQQIEKQVDGPFGIGTTVHEITNEDDPTLLVIGQLLEFFEDHLQLVDLAMHIADHRDRPLNFGLECRYGHKDGFRELTKYVG